MKNTKQAEASSFAGLGIAPRLLEILRGLDFQVPTPIQLQSIPVSLEGKDMVGIAQTGTGKTLAFGIPMLQRLAVNKGTGLVVAPTRELALQADEHLKRIGQKLGLRTSVLIGGEPINRQIRTLKLKPHIIIATPGRLIDHTQRRTVDLSNVKILVLDEADMMLDMGFLPQIKDILKQLPKERQTMLFSATMPAQIVKIAAEYMSVPTRIEVAPPGTSAENVEQEFIVIGREGKFDHLKKILNQAKGSVLIFMRTKHAVKNLTRKLKLIGFGAAEIHSNRSQGQRRQALEGFKLGRYRILIATDIAARGIDVKDIELVINYDLPQKSDDYVHRIGRTARAGQSGLAVSFVLPSQLKNVREIEALIKKTIKIDKSALGCATSAPGRSAPSGKDHPKRGGRPAPSARSAYNRRPKPVRGKRKGPRPKSGKSRSSSASNRRNQPARRTLTDRERFQRSMKTGRR